MQVITVLIRKDAHTTTPDYVFEHEIKILKSIFGTENVYVKDKSHDAELNSENEYERLVNKYGPEPVSNVYGVFESGKLEDVIASKAVKRVAPTKE